MFARPPATRVRGAARATVLLVTVLQLIGAVGTAHADDIVRVSTIPGDPQADAVVTLGPLVQPAPADEIRWRIVNGADAAVVLDLSLRELGTADDGSIRVETALPVTFEQPTLQLGPGDGADVAVSRREVADQVAPGFALVATGDGIELVGIVVAARTAPASATARLVRDDGRLRGSVSLQTPRSIVTDVRARLVRWPGRPVADRSIPNVVVLPGGRSVDLDLAGAAFVGPVDLEVVAGDGDQDVRAAARAWIVNRTAVRSVGSLVLVATVLALVTAVVRLRRRRHPTPVP